MLGYAIRRLLLLPLTLFCIVLVNFVIINLAPGDPVTVTEVSQEGGASRKEDQSFAFGSDDRYLQFREHYGLTLPILINRWPWISRQQVQHTLWTMVHRREWEGGDPLDVKEYDKRRVLLGDQARFIMPHLLATIESELESVAIRHMAMRFFIRGGTLQARVGPTLSIEDRAYNRKIGMDNDTLRRAAPLEVDDLEELAKKAAILRRWYDANAQDYHYDPDTIQKISSLLFQTRFARYLARVITLDFGTLRSDSNKTVSSEVVKRFKYSLTLALLPMLITFLFCQCFGMVMALTQNQWPDMVLNILFLALYAIPIFVVAPFLIEKVALNRTFPFTDIPIPLSGFTSRESLYTFYTSQERLWDTLQHIALPLVAVMYGGLAAQSRLSRTAILEVMRQDYVRTARAKGLGRMTILLKHVGRNAGITIVTSIAGSLGIILGGSLIVETLFEIDGFGKFFYDAVIERDYNVIMFSALAGATLSLIGYLMADLAYTLLDPRVTLD